MKASYLVFILQACGDADTKLLKLCPETVEATAAIRSRVAKLKSNWGESSPQVRVVVPANRHSPEGSRGN